MENASRENSSGNSDTVMAQIVVMTLRLLLEEREVQPKTSVSRLEWVVIIGFVVIVLMQARVLLTISLLAAHF